jgi:hypothetical protein
MKYLFILGLVVFATAGFGLWQWSQGNVPQTTADVAPAEVVQSIPTPNTNLYRVMDSVDKVTAATENGYTRTIYTIRNVAIAILATIVLIILLAVLQLGRSKIVLAGVTNFKAGTKTSIIGYAGDRSDRVPLATVKAVRSIASSAIPNDHLIDD